MTMRKQSEKNNEKGYEAMTPKKKTAGANEMFAPAFVWVVGFVMDVGRPAPLAAVPICGSEKLYGLCL